VCVCVFVCVCARALVCARAVSLIAAYWETKRSATFETSKSIVDTAKKAIKTIILNIEIK